MLNLHYGLIHNGLPSQIDINNSSLPAIKAGNEPRRITLCKEGDIAFADASEDTNDVGKVVEFVDCAGKNVVCGLHTIHGRDKLDITVLGFKVYAFSSKAFHDQIKRIAQGTKVFSISVGCFDEVCVGIPSKEEQKRIAGLLSLIDQRIAIQNKVIEKYESLIRAIILRSQSSSFSRKVYLREILNERKELNEHGYDICSVSVSKGVVNQVECLGRSFAAKETAHYHVVHKGDIVYTKSPTGEFPYGIIKQSYLDAPVAVSPLYGVYKPIDYLTGIYLHHFFCSPQNAKNYLHKLIQKGAKNTINITNQHFLDNLISIPEDDALQRIVALIEILSAKVSLERKLLSFYSKQKTFLLSKLFI